MGMELMPTIHEPPCSNSQHGADAGMGMELMLELMVAMGMELMLPWSQSWLHKLHAHCKPMPSASISFMPMPGHAHAGMSSMPTAVHGIMIPMHMPSISSMQTWS